MPLPSSGPLSLNDIAGEFGGSQPHSLSEYYAGGGLVPAGTSGTYGAVPSSGTISIQNFYGTSNVVYWVNRVNSGVNSTIVNISLETNGNFNVTTGDRAALRYTSDGATLSWATTMFSGGSGLSGAETVGGVTIAAQPGGTQSNLVGLNSSGSAYAWQYVVTCTNGGFGANISSVSAYSSGTLAGVSGQATGVAGSDVRIAVAALTPSSGSINSNVAYVISGGNPDCSATAIAQNNSSGFIITGFVKSDTQTRKPFIASLNSSLGVSWARLISGPEFVVGNGNPSTRCIVASSGNIYMFYNYFDSGFNQRALISKYNSGGTHQWSLDCNRLASELALDSSENIYVTFCNPDSSQATALKINSSGTVQWQRRITNAAGMSRAIGIGSSGAVYFTAQNTGAVFVFKAPNDGSKTGSYTVGGQTLDYIVGTIVTTASYTPTVTSLSLIQDNFYQFLFGAGGFVRTSNSLTLNRTLI